MTRPDLDLIESFLGAVSVELDTLRERSQPLTPDECDTLSRLAVKLQRLAARISEWPEISQ